MNCAHVRDMLPAFAEDDLGPAERDNIARHLDGCAACRARLSLDKTIATALARFTPIPEAAREQAVQRRTWERIARLRKADESASPGRSFGHRASAVLGLIAIALIVLLLIVLGKPVLDERAAPTALPIPPPHLLLVGPVVGSADHFGMRPIDPTTLADLPGHAPLDFGHSYVGTLSPDGRTLAAFVWPTGVPESAGKLHLFDIAADVDAVTGVTADNVYALTFGLNGRSLYWITPIYDGAVGNGPNGWTLYRADLPNGSSTVVRTLPATFVPRDVRALPNGMLAVYGIPTAPSGMATDVPHLLLVNPVSGQVNSDLPLAGMKAGQYPEADPTTGQTGARMYQPGIAWDLVHERLYVASPDTNRIVVVDLAHGHVIQSADVHPPTSLLDRLLRWIFPSAAAKSEPTTHRIAALSPDGRRLYLVGEREETAWSSSGLDVVDTSDLSLVAHLSLPVSDMVLSRDGKSLLLHLWWPATSENPEHQALAILDAREFAEQGHLVVDSPFKLIGSSADGREAYISRNFQRPDGTWETRVSVADLASRRVVAERGFSENGAPALISFIGLWRDGTWEQ